MDHAVVLALDHVHQQTAHAGDGVQGLHVNGAGDGHQQRTGDQLDHGHHRIAEHVAEPDGAVGHALCPGQLDVVLVGLVHHVAAQPHTVAGQSQGQNGQHHCDGFALAPKHGAVQQFGAVNLDQQEIDGVGHGLDDDDIRVAQFIQDAALVQRHGDTQDHAQRQRDCHRDQAEPQRNQDLGRQDLRDGHIFTITAGNTQVALENALQKAEHLDINRVLQSQFL